MDSTHLYDVSVRWETGRKGVLHSPVLNNDIEVATPPEFQKGIPGVWSPEHLLVAAVNSCLMTTFLAVADNSKLPFEHFDCTATGKLERSDGSYMISEIILKPVVKISNKADELKTLKLLQKSESACIISNSIKSKIIFLPKVEII